ncbi:MAG: FAD-binding domain-containing protein, partial [Verrucomicrobiota bacterium]
WEVRGVGYTMEMARRVPGYEACSRISPYLTYGVLSVREVYQRGMERKGDLLVKKQEGLAFDKRWNQAMKSFLGRLRWHCHFMQKLEDEPSIEWENFSPVYDGLREESWNEVFFEAWKEGRTGYPMVDACMRAVRATGYLNFRMRAMVMSFASYHLWLHWRETGLHLARMFTDYEPGIHWSQSQMQSGTTGINTVRVYSPRKQVEDQDAEGVFVKRWVPELAGVPEKFLAEPHLMPEMEQQFCGCVIGKDYPAPVVEHKVAYAEAQRRVRAVRVTQEARAEADRVQERHGSRRRGTRTWR